MRTLAGLATARGFAVGPVFIYRGEGAVPIPEYRVEPGDETGELMRLRRAMDETRRDLEGLVAVLRQRTGRADVRVFECHLLILDDATLLDETKHHITEDRLNAEAAVRKTMSGARAKFERMNDPYFRERVRDFDDIERRLLKALMGFARSPQLELKTPCIVVADDLTPSETVQLPREYVLGFATNGGSTTSHVALLARALSIPAVTGLGNITAQVHPGETVLLDGTNGAITLNPDAAARHQFEILLARQREMAEAASSGVRAGTLKDGSKVYIYANVHPGVPVAGIKEYGAQGVGLYRSEYLWLSRELEPSEEEQYEAYLTAVKFAAGLSDEGSITIRVLDIGGDKLVRGISSKEANPFLGNRSIRYLLSHRQVMCAQLRSILRASVEGHVGILYPMVSCVEELREAATVLASVKRQLDEDGIAYDPNVRVGAMIEVPSAALNAEAFAPYVDFFSIGTNDLVQYTMAADRGNEAVAHLYQPLNRAVIRLVKMTIDAAEAQGKRVGVCGESASDPIVGIYWAALGANSLSMSATYIPVMAKLFSRLTREDLAEYARVPDQLPLSASAQEIFEACRAWMGRKIPDLEDLLI